MPLLASHEPSQSLLSSNDARSDVWKISGVCHRDRLHGRLAAVNHSQCYFDISTWAISVLKTRLGLGYSPMFAASL